MVLHFNVKGDSRKAMVAAIERELGCRAKYLGVPSCAYEIGCFTVGRNGELEFDDSIGIAETAPIIDACVMATGVSPDEWENNDTSEDETDSTENENLGLTVTIPLDKVSVGNLTSLLDAKGELIKRALGIADLRFAIDEENISFPWFEEVTPDEALAYTKFIAALCEMSKKQKRVTAKPRENENEKYAFRCFLLRLGFIGTEYKEERKILLKNLTGSSAFKTQAGGNK